MAQNYHPFIEKKHFRTFFGPLIGSVDIQRGQKVALLMGETDVKELTTQSFTDNCTELQRRSPVCSGNVSQGYEESGWVI